MRNATDATIVFHKLSRIFRRNSNCLEKKLSTPLREAIDRKSDTHFFLILSLLDIEFVRQQFQNEI